MAPGINESFGIKRELRDVGQLEQARARGNQEANAELNRRNTFFQTLLGQHAEQIQIPIERRPRSERDKRRLKDEAESAEVFDNRKKISPRVPFLEERQHLIIHGLHGAGDEQAAGVTKPREMFSMFAEVLDFDSDVISNVRVLVMKAFYNRQGVADAVEKIGIAEGDVFGASHDLPANVFKDHFAANNAKHAVIDRDNRTMPAEMLAAAAGFGVTHGAMLAAGDDQVRILVQRDEPGAVGDVKFQPRERSDRLGLPGGDRGPVGLTGVADSRNQMRQPLFEFSPEHGVNAEPAQIRFIHRGVKAVKTDMRSGIQFSNQGNQRHREARGRMHGHVERNQISPANGVFSKRFTREIETRYLRASVPEPRCRRRQPKRLAAQFVRRDEHDIQRSTLKQRL